MLATSTMLPHIPSRNMAINKSRHFKKHTSGAKQRISTAHSSFYPLFLIITIPQFGITTNIPKYHTDYLYRGGLSLKYICFYEFV
jgi:hypothetical protein